MATKKTKINKKEEDKKKSQVNKKTSTKKTKKDPLLNNELFKEAEKLYKDKQYIEAYNNYIEVLKEFKNNKKIYLRLIECLTNDFSIKYKSKEFKLLFEHYIELYKGICTKKELDELNKKLEDYKLVKYTKSKSRFILIAFLGYFGVHKFMDKKIVKGIIYLLTLGLFGIGVIIDLINDYAEHEDDFQLDIMRYFISLLIIVFGIIRHDTANFYYFIIIGILFTPIVYSKLLRFIPNIIKLIVIGIMVYLGFKTVPVINYVPTTAIGTWTTKNENTNFKELKIELENTTLKFEDRKKQKGTNDYDTKNHILTIKIDDDTYYKFILNLKDEEICVFTESQECFVKFKKKK